MEAKLRIEIEKQLREKFNAFCAKDKSNLETKLKKKLETEMGELVLSNFVNSPQFQERLKQEIEKESDEFVLNNIEHLLQSTRIDYKAAWINSCPKGVFKGIDDIEDFDKKWWTPANNDSCIVCNACVLEAEEKLLMDNLITVDFSESRFICNIVGLGVIQPKEILLRAIEILDNKYAALEEAMKKLL